MQPAAAPARPTEQQQPLWLSIAYRKLSDVDLVSKARDGDRRALDVLVERHTPRVNRLATQLMGDLEEARDAAQESLVKLCTRLRQFRGESQFATWLHRLVVNTCRDRLARQRIRQTEHSPSRMSPRVRTAIPRALRSWRTSVVSWPLRSLASPRASGS